ncbi:hypothetical protein BG004_005616 [Podila humilis]|nr:hypothetical protein BG004_005616 [Podila humilis]
MVASAPTLIVTGASRGIGRSIVLLAIQKQNANVIGVARSKEALEQLAHHIEHDLQLKDRFKFVVGDITQESTSIEALSLASNSWNGAIVGLVLNAGVLDPIQPIATAPIDAWKKNFDVNFFSIIDIIQKALPALRKSKGRIVLVSSAAAVLAFHAWGAYCTAKASMDMFAKVLGLEEPDVTTVSIYPGVVDTQMQTIIRSEVGSKAMIPEQHEEFITLHSTKKLLHPDQPGAVLAALAVSAENTLSGKIFSWDDAAIAAHRQQ